MSSKIVAIKTTSTSLVTVYSNVVYKVKLIFNQIVKDFFQTVKPFKDLDYFRQYFLTAEKVIIKDADTIFSSKVYFYYIVHYFLFVGIIFPFYSLSSSTRVLLGDFVHIMFKEKQFYFIFAILVFYTVFLFWALFFKPSNVKLNEVLCCALNSDKVLAIETGVRFAGAKSPLTFRQLILIFINSLQVFNWVISFCIPLNVLVMGNAFLLSFPVSYKTSWSQLLWSAFLYMILLFQTFINLTFWYAFAYVVILLATHVMMALTYTVLQFSQNYAHLKRALRRLMKGLRAVPPLVGVLQENLVHFRLVFLIDNFYRLHATTYIGLHVPLAAFFLMQLLFRKVTLTPWLVMTGIALESFIGCLLVHIYMAFFSGYIHRSGKMLLQFSAATSGSGVVRLTFKERLLISSHICRLVVRKKYGVTLSGGKMACY